MNLPNWLSFSRILLVPAFVALLLVRYQKYALAVFLIALATDWLDGFLARRRSQVTTLGKLLDPLADKLLICSAFIALAQIDAERVCHGGSPEVRAWMVVIIVSREFAVTGLRSIAMAKGVAIPASRLGKLKMIGQSVAVVLLILGRGWLGRFGLLVPIVLWAAVALAFLSMVQYFRRFARESGFD